MKNCRIIFIAIIFLMPLSLLAQDAKEVEKRTKDIYGLINKYSVARENRDTLLLKTILTEDIDQLVSSGEWRNGLNEAVQGMLRSSATSPGTRTLTVEKLKFLDSKNAIADARYEIKNPDGTTRKMWSTFVVVQQKGNWKISAIRNMLPAAQP
jgi:ketosteroid isomerase-like protein